MKEAVTKVVLHPVAGRSVSLRPHLPKRLASEKPLIILTARKRDASSFQDEARRFDQSCVEQLYATQLN